MDPTLILDAAPVLGEMARAVVLSAVGAIIGGRLGWLFYRREMRVHRAALIARRPSWWRGGR